MRGRDKRWRGEDHQFRWLHKRPLKKKNTWDRYKKMRSPRKHKQFRFQTFTTLVLVGLCKKVHKSWFKFTSWFRGGRGFDFGWMLIKTFLVLNLKLNSQRLRSQDIERSKRTETRGWKPFENEPSGNGQKSSKLKFKHFEMILSWKKLTALQFLNHEK